MKNKKTSLMKIWSAIFLFPLFIASLILKVYDDYKIYSSSTLDRSKIKYNEKKHSYYEGLRLGMLLQIAVGPICMYIFSLGTNATFLQAELGVLGVVLADSIFIFCAVMGIASFLKNKEVQNKFMIFGAVVIIIFGLQLFATPFHLKTLLNIKFEFLPDARSAFFKAFFLTISSPLAILFWMGIFTTKLNKKILSKVAVKFFSLGALSATVIFLTFVAFVGSQTKLFLPIFVIEILNSIVGVILIYFGIAKLKGKR